MSALTQNTLVKNCHTLKLWFLEIEIIIVKLRRGSGKDRQGMAPKVKSLKA